MIYLQSKSRVTMDQLETKFELTRRTLFRDIKALIEGGLPIGGDAGTGYFIVEGYHLPPVVFNKEEASALLLGAKFVAHQADAETSSRFDQALTKVKAVMKYGDKEHLDRLEENITVMPGPGTQTLGSPASHLQVIQEGIALQHTLTFDYYSAYNDQVTSREVEPLGLVYYSNRWHLMAFCRLRQDLRDFRTDRIKKVTMNAQTFEREAHPSYLDFLNKTLLGTDALEATIKVDAEGSRIMREHKYNFGFVSEEQEDSWTVMTFSTPSYEYLCRWLISYTSSIRLLGPEELKQTMRRLVDDLREVHR